MKVNTGAAAALLALALGACSNVDFKKTKGGMPYKVIASNSGKNIDTGNIVKLQIVQKIKDSLLYSSYQSGQPIYVPVSAKGSPYDFTEVLPSLKEGDSLYTVQLMDTFIKRQPQMVPPNFKNGDTITTGIRVVKVFANAQEAQKDEQLARNVAFDRDTMVQNQLQKDDAAIKDYLQAKNINAQKTGKGTYVQILTPGTGTQITDGKYVSVKYTGTTFGGFVFDTNADPKKGNTAPLIFQVGAPGMIRGFDEGMHLLREGSKAKLIIPSMLAYGPQSPGPEIKPFENLVFDIEVLQVSDQPIRQQMQLPRGVDTLGRK